MRYYVTHLQWYNNKEQLLLPVRQHMFDVGPACPYQYDGDQK